MKKIILTVLFLMSFSSHGLVEISQCGKYWAQVHIDKENKKLLVNFNTDSEFEIIDDEFYSHKDSKNGDYILEFNVKKACSYKCRVNITKVAKRISPLHKTRFFTHPAKNRLKLLKCSP